MIINLVTNDRRIITQWRLCPYLIPHYTHAYVCVTPYSFLQISILSRTKPISHKKEHSYLYEMVLVSLLYMPYL